ncbi:polysaccharide deacetylase family protein [Phycisphaerales bacterium AB-hyl4]|uniref:Polysaccharide deacetylase family protein n=1 Tax=Natronomicrosphaera hydrolytica TaxID=3242702 RepID=A0ABV4U7F0_9BACT
MNLMYHSITINADPRPASQFHRNKYTVHVDQLADHVRRCEGQDVVFTFDDGHVSIHEHAYPLVVNRVKTILFISLDFVGTANWLSAAQLREMHGRGVAIAGHGCGHLNLASLPAAQLKHELEHSRRGLEDIIGSEVTAMSLVGGHYNRRVLEAARDVGYETIYSSEPVAGVTRHGLHGRVCVYWTTTGDEIDAYRQGRVSRQMQLAYYLKRPLKCLLAERVRRKHSG